MDALTAPLRAAAPAWNADLAAYSDTVARGAGHGTGQLVIAALLLGAAAAIMLPDAWRRDSVVVGVALAAILAPGAWHLPWALAIVIGAVVAIGLGAFTLTADDRRGQLDRHRGNVRRRRLHGRHRAGPARPRRRCC